MENQRPDHNDFLTMLREVYENRIPFSKLLGLKVESLDMDNVVMSISKKEELVGNYVKGLLHGGVICSILDTTGGLTATIGMLSKMTHLTIENLAKRITGISTIDLRVDYLRPGKGEVFYATGSVLRFGNKVAVTRMYLRDDEELLIAVATGTYMVG